MRSFLLLPFAAAFLISCVHENYQEFVDKDGTVHSCESYANLGQRHGAVEEFMIADSQYKRCLQRARANGWVSPEEYDAIKEAQKPAYRDEEEREQLEEEVKELKKKIRRSRELRNQN